MKTQEFSCVGERQKALLATGMVHGRREVKIKKLLIF
jgi:hypothetical protein